MTLASQKLASELHISGSTLRATVRAHPQQHNMIQRSLLRQLRASSSRLQKPSVFSSPRLSFPAPRIPALSSRQQLYPRCYYTTAEAKASPEGETSAAEAKTSPRAETSAAEEAPSEAKEAGEDPIQKELAATKAQVIDLKDKYLRSVADFRNLQDRTKRDIQSAKDFAISRFAKDLVESIDNLDRALSTVPPEILHPPPAPQSETPPPPAASPNKDLINLYQGLKMTEQILMQTLKKHGLERFDPSERGEKFDPNLHEATFMTKVEGKEEGTAFHTQQKGFLLNGRVIRAAKVGVVKNT